MVLSAPQAGFKEDLTAVLTLLKLEMLDSKLAVSVPVSATKQNMPYAVLAMLYFALNADSAAPIIRSYAA